MIPQNFYALTSPYTIVFGHFSALNAPPLVPAEEFFFLSYFLFPHNALLCKPQLEHFHNLKNILHVLSSNFELPDRSYHEYLFLFPHNLVLCFTGSSE